MTSELRTCSGKTSKGDAVALWYMHCLLYVCTAACYRVTNDLREKTQFNFRTEQNSLK